MRKRRISVVGSIAVVVAVAVVSVGCSNPSPPKGTNWVFSADSITSIKQNEHSGPNFWDNDNYDEPYLAHMGVRIRLNGPTTVELFVQSTYNNNGQYICKLQQGQTCAGIPGDGADFYSVYQPDFVELSQGQQLELLGSIEFSFERDQLVPFGIVQALTGIAQTATKALPTIIANGGALPTDPAGLLNFIEQVIPPALSTLVSIVASNLGAAIGGDGDDFIGFEPFLYFAVGGELKSLLQGILPTLLNLVNIILKNDPQSPLPNGIPAILGVLGDGDAFTFGAADVAPKTLYKISYKWHRF